MKILVAIDTKTSDVSLYQSVHSFLRDASFAKLSLVTENSQFADEDQIQKELDYIGSCIVKSTQPGFEFTYKLSYETIRE